MHLLTKDQFELAGTFLKTKARKLERLLYEYEYESQPYSAVLNELLTYQNDDGGFGHGLEPDLRSNESSALATTRALEILHLNRSSIEVVKKSLAYLEQSFIPERFGWDIIPKIAEEAPRAIWWEYGAFKDNWGNPNADILSFFMDYRSEYQFYKLSELIEYGINHLMYNCELNEMHELFCYLHFAERLNYTQRLQIDSHLNLFMENCININTLDRSKYGATPLHIVDSPRSPSYNKYIEQIPSELDHLILQQTQDGSWEPNWSWYQFEEEWLTAKEEWKGILTLNALRILRNFNRIET